MAAVKVLLVLECLYVSADYIKTHTVDEKLPVREISGQESDAKSVYGVGFSGDAGEVFWFHSQIEIEND